MSDTILTTCFYSDKFKDFQGKTVELCWTEKLWTTHVNKHPEIFNQANTSKLVKEALLSPSLVVSGYRPGNAKEMLVCYYKEYKRSGNEVYYSKIVVGCRGPSLYVKTVFMGWALGVYAVQEKKYDFKEVYRDIKTYL